jgi:hypothetical protein
MNNRRITRMRNRAAPQKELKGAIFDECAKMISEMKTKKDRKNIAEALAILFRHTGPLKW